MEQSYLYITQVLVFVLAHLLGPFYPSVRPSRKGEMGLQDFAVISKKMIRQSFCLNERKEFKRFVEKASNVLFISMCINMV